MMNGYHHIERDVWDTHPVANRCRCIIEAIDNLVAQLGTTGIFIDSLLFTREIYYAEMKRDLGGHLS